MNPVFTLGNGVSYMNPATGTADGLFTIQANSGQRGDHSRDKRTQKDVLQSGKYPKIIFLPTHASGNFDFSKDQRLTVDEFFHLRDADHPLQLGVHVIAGTGDPLRATMQFSIPYV
jgi:polyisoprenoid-binding protein YceI